MVRKQYYKKVIDLSDIGVPNVWGYFEDGVLGACDEVCGKKRCRSKGDTLWYNDEVMETISIKKDAHKVMCRNSTEKNKNRYNSMKNKARKHNLWKTKVMVSGCIVNDLKVVYLP